MAKKQKVVSEESPFLKSAAEAIGTTIGRLALRAGVVKPPAAAPVAKPKKATPKKRTVASKKAVAESTAKKAARKSSR